MAELQRRGEIRVGDFLGRALEHERLLFHADVHQVEVALRHLRVGRVGDELAVDASDADRANGTSPWNVTDHQRGGRANHAENVRVVFPVGTEQNALHLDFVIPALGKKRTNGPVNHPAGQDFLFCRTAFPFEVTAGEPARRRRLLPVIHGERKELLAGLGAGGSDGGYDDDAFAELNRDGAVGLFGEFAGLDVDGFGSYLDRYFVWHNVSIMPVDPEELHSTPAVQTLKEISQCQRAFVCARLVVVRSTPD